MPGVLRATRDASGVVDIRGDLDVANADELRRAIDHGDVLRLDLSGVEFLGAAALRVLVEVQRRRRDEGRELWIVRPSRVVVRTLEVAGLLDALVAAPDG